MSGAIVITRAKEQGQKFASALSVFGFETLHAPMIKITPLHFDAFGEAPDAFIATSANAFYEQDERLSSYLNVPVFSVGAATKAAAVNIGFSEVHSADGDACDLVDLLAAQFDSLKTLIYLRARHISRDITPDLQNHGFNVQERICYDVVATSSLPLNLAQAQLQAITFFSKRTAEIFFSLMQDVHLPSSIKYLCISDEVLECVRVLSGSATEHLFAARTPDHESMVTLVKEHCVPLQ